MNPNTHRAVVWAEVIWPTVLAFFPIVPKPSKAKRFRQTGKDLNAVDVPSGVVRATSRHKMTGENGGEGVFSSATLKNSFTPDKDELVFKGVVQKKK